MSGDNHDDNVAKQPVDLLDSFHQLSKESGITLSVMANHYRDGTVEYNIEFNHELYPTGIPLRAVTHLLTYVTQLVIKQAEARHSNPEENETDEQ